MQGAESIPKKLRPLGYRPTKYVTCYNGHNINGFKFHIQQYGYHKSTTNSGVCIKDSWWAETETDYYRILEEVMKLTYLEGNSVILFKYWWFDIDNCMKVDLWHGLIEIKYR